MFQRIGNRFQFEDSATTPNMTRIYSLITVRIHQMDIQKLFKSHRWTEALNDQISRIFSHGSKYFWKVTILHSTFGKLGRFNRMYTCNNLVKWFESSDDSANRSITGGKFSSLFNFPFVQRYIKQRDLSHIYTLI